MGWRASPFARIWLLVHRRNERNKILGAFMQSNSVSANNLTSMSDLQIEKLDGKNNIAEFSSQHT